VAGKLPGEQAAEAPADDQDLLLAADAVDTLFELVQRLGLDPGIPAEAPAVNAIALGGQRLAQRGRRPVSCEEAWDDEDRIAFLGSDRALRAEAVPEPREVPAELRPAGQARGRRIIAFKRMLQRYSPPIKSCSAFGSLTRPSSIW
jgi:hypothetical protein